MALPAGDMPEPFVDADDIADVAVAALTEDGHIGQVYELTGPRLLTFAEAVDEISKARPRDPLRADLGGAVAAAAAEAGVPREFIELLTYLFSEVLDGRNAYLPTASSGRSAGSRGISASTRATPPPPGSGTHRR